MPASSAPLLAPASFIAEPTSVRPPPLRLKSVRKKRGQDLSGICKTQALSEAAEVLSPFFPNALRVWQDFGCHRFDTLWLDSLGDTWGIGVSHSQKSPADGGE